MIYGMYLSATGVMVSIASDMIKDPQRVKKGERKKASEPLSNERANQRVETSPPVSFVYRVRQGFQSGNVSTHRFTPLLW